MTGSKKKKKTHISYLDFCISNCADGGTVYCGDEIFGRRRFGMGSP